MTNIYNVYIVGTLTNNNGVLSGFSQNDYAIIQAVPGIINSFEMVIKVRTGSDVTTYQSASGQVYTNIHTPQLNVPTNNSGNIRFSFPLGTNSWSNIDTSFSIQANTDYWLKMVYDGSNNIGYYSTDGENYIQAGSVSNPNGIQWDEPIELGNDQGLYPFYGSIDLNECYIKVNNVYLWKGVTEIQPLTSDYKLVKVAERKYYKYIDSPWTQPVFTSNTTWGTVSADNYSSSSGQVPWHALDGYTSGGDGQDFASSGSSTVNWYWDFAYPLKISSIQMWNRNNAGSYGGAETYTIYGKNSDDTYEQIGTISLAAVGWISGSTNISSVKEYYGLKINCAGTRSYAGIGEILLTATTTTIEPGTAQDYDYYEDVVTYKAIKAFTERKYYKYKEVATGYRELAALTSNGNGFINTGFYPSSNTKIRAKAIYSHYSGGYFLGNATGNESDSFRFFRAGDTTYLDYGSGERYNRIQGTYLTSTTDAYEFEIGNRYVKDIPTDTIKISGSAVSFSTKSYVIRIFESVDYGTLNYMQILENDVLERDFVPCLDVTNDVVGLYDKVNDVFYQSPSGWIRGDYVIEDGTAQDYDFYEDVYSYKAIEKPISN